MSSLNCMGPRCRFREGVVVGEDQVGTTVTLMQCSSCKKVAYCSKECQRAHWPAHKKNCKRLQETGNILDIDNTHKPYEELKKAFDGDHAPASERIRWHSLTDSDPKSRKAHAFTQKLDIEAVGQYAVKKFVEDGWGAVVFNLNYPVPQVGPSGRYLWAPRGGLARSGDALLFDTVNKYDPEHTFVMVFAFPSSDLLSVDVWSMEVFFTLPAELAPSVRRAKTKHAAMWNSPGNPYLKRR
ncbi:hypothetical protein BOTBODRAFT_361666 [Botryobasidium botryosum FD-172 SS1]|uniref:MYND-type domain-containing protein n=1 Tax=Botryobasidium botryosum (strain FD-172 SS1) TaxID=930990 RepID=A0A067ME88_BOTB1|nr:hypothetical protein BOTBODRAFT_361666 [Botryobasidium botryosum FD-172 SS1]